jgi:Outer membrane protein beta-barrel domain
VLRSLTAAGLAVAFLAISAVPARAEGFIVPYLGFNYGGNSNCASLTNCEEKRTNFGVSIGSMGNVVGFEQDFGFAKDFFGKVPGADNSVFTLMSNVLIGAGGGRVQPYGLFGMGLIRPHTSLNVASALTSFSKNSFGYDYGFGISGYFAHSVGIRGDIRRFKTWGDVPILGGVSEDKLDFWRASLGLALRF